MSRTLPSAHKTVAVHGDAYDRPIADKRAHFSLAFQSLADRVYLPPAGWGVSTHADHLGPLGGGQKAHFVLGHVSCERDRVSVLRLGTLKLRATVRAASWRAGQLTKPVRRDALSSAA